MTEMTLEGALDAARLAWERFGTVPQVVYASVSGQCLAFDVSGGPSSVSPMLVAIKAMQALSAAGAAWTLFYSETWMARVPDGDERKLAEFNQIARERRINELPERKEAVLVLWAEPSRQVIMTAHIDHATRALGEWVETVDAVSGYASMRIYPEQPIPVGPEVQDAEKFD